MAWLRAEARMYYAGLVLTCRVFTLSEMDYSPPEMRTASKFLQRMDELLAESFQLQRFPSLTLDAEEHALRLAQAMRNSVQSARDSIRSDCG